MKDFSIRRLYKRLNEIEARCFESLEVCPPRGSENDYVNEYQSLGELFVYREGIEARLSLAQELLCDFFPWEGRTTWELIEQYPSLAESFVQDYCKEAFRKAYEEGFVYNEAEYLEVYEDTLGVPFKEYVKASELMDER